MSNTPSYYTYFISSLPMLHFGMKSPFSFEKFLTLCKGIISDNDIALIKASVTETEDTNSVSQPREAEWRAFDTALRNELVKIRAARKHMDPAKYLRGDTCVDSHITHIATTAYRNPSLVESEKILDQTRWHALDGISAGHYFDVDFLIVYAHKLLILMRWEKIDAANKEKALEEALA